MQTFKKLILYRKLIPPVFWQLCLAHWQIHCTKFKNLSTRLGSVSGGELYQPNAGELEDIRKISAAIQKIAQWCHFKCFAQAIAAQRLLIKKNIPTQLYLGLNKQASQLKAHAWLTCGNIFITGKRGHDRFTSVICYHQVKT